jgi:hypothetical protein
MPHFLGVEADEELVLDGVGMLLDFPEVQPARSGEGDDVAAPVGGVGLAVYLAGTLEAIEDAVDAQQPCPS